MNDSEHNEDVSANNAIVLHLTDLHFGCDEREYDLVRRELVLNALIQELKRLDPAWKPNVVAVSGDIGWKGKTSDYEIAQRWFHQLLAALDLDSGSIVLCPGNHDVDQGKWRSLVRPASLADADRILQPLIADHWQAPFEAYMRFCCEMGIPDLALASHASHLVGVRELKGVRFVCLNSAWFCQGQHDKGNLWLGLPHLHTMEHADQLPIIDQSGEATPTIALLHHPREYFAEPDIHVQPNTGRQAALSYLAQRCHLMLCGHVHSGSQPADRLADGAYYLVGGATYASADYSNNFRIVRIERDSLVYRSFESDPRSSTNVWMSHQPASALAFQKAAVAPAGVPAKVAIGALRDAAAKHARQMIETKSRQMKPRGGLPEFVSLTVTVQPAETDPAHQDHSKPCRDRRPRATRIPFGEAIRHSRRSFLLGDLGTGKSTVSGIYATNANSGDEGLLALIVPAAALRLPEQLRNVELLDAIDDYVSSHIAPESDVAPLREVLQSGHEVTLIFDGLDEVPRQVARSLLQVAAGLIDHWPNIQVVAVGRPVELAGLNYSAWHVLRLDSLPDEDRARILLNEATASGKDAAEARDEQQRTLRILTDHPTLDALATTPLAVRLLYPRLISASPSDEISLGDLLHALLTERLGGWAEKDGKAVPWQDFAKACPDGQARALLLGEIAYSAYRPDGLTPEKARLCLASHGRKLGLANPDAFACEALDFLENSGILLQNESIRFPLQPLQEAAAGLWLSHLWRTSETAEDVSVDLWRVVSFAAAATRRAGTDADSKQPFFSFIDAVLSDAWGIPRACFVAAELKDAETATKTINSFNRIGYRPFTWFGDERVASARAIAQTLLLAGDAGFEWLYDEYLDPRYPIINRGCAVIQSVFWQWAVLARERLTPKQSEKLAGIVKPLLATSPIGAHSFDRVLVLLVPDCFTDKQRLWLHSGLLGTVDFGHEAERLLLHAASQSHQALVEDILRRYPGQNAPGTLLWLKSYPDRPPDMTVGRHLLLGAARSPRRSDFGSNLQAYCVALGEIRWTAFLRWSLTDHDRYVAASAAIELYRRGEPSLELIGSALWEGMHDGGYIAEAEASLLAVIESEGRVGVEWLVRRFRTDDDLDYGAHSGCWRILLKTISVLDDDASTALATCSGRVGCFLMARHPELRHRFRQLLAGPKGNAYRNALRHQLLDLRPEVRHGAAMILVTADQENEGEALAVALQSRECRSLGHWSEWESFLMSLAFGPGILTYIRRNLPTLGRASRLLALALLARNGMSLSPEENSELALGLAGWGDRHLNVDTLGDARLASKTARATLVVAISGAPTDKTQYVADALLKFHGDTLSDKEKARCIALSAHRYYVRDFLTDEMNTVATSPQMLAHLEGACRKLAAQGMDRTSLLSVIRALQDPKEWRDALWALFCAGDSVFDIDDVGEAILVFARKNPEHGEQIGKEAKAILDDPRLEKNRWVDRYHWLALVADEIVGLTADEFATVLGARHPIYSCATYSLIARCGTVPPSYQKRPKAGDVPADLGAPAATPGQQLDDLPNRLREVGRSSEILHPEACSLVEEAIWSGEVDEVLLRSVAEAGANGRLLSGVLRFCLGFPPSATDAIASMDPLLKPAQAQDPCFRRLRKLGLLSHTAALRQNLNVCKAYLAELDRALRADKGWKQDYIYEILRVQKTLLPDQIPVVFEHITSGTGRWALDNEVGEMLVRWLTGESDATVKETILTETRHAIARLNLHPWDNKAECLRSPVIYLIFPLAYWLYDGHTTPDSTAVFLRGMKYLFVLRQRDRFSVPVNQLMSIVEPLLLRTPAGILRDVARVGAESPDPVVRAWCHMMSEMSPAVIRCANCSKWDGDSIATPSPQ